MVVASGQIKPLESLDSVLGAAYRSSLLLLSSLGPKHAHSANLRWLTISYLAHLRDLVAEAGAPVDSLKQRCMRRLGWQARCRSELRVVMKAPALDLRFHRDHSSARRSSCPPSFSLNSEMTGVWYRGCFGQVVETRIRWDRTRCCFKLDKRVSRMSWSFSSIAGLDQGDAVAVTDREDLGKPRGESEDWEEGARSFPIAVP